VKEETIKGCNHRDVKVYIDDTNQSDCLVIIYPGFNYGFNHPLFYYLRNLLQECSKDYIFFDYNWGNMEGISRLTRDEILALLSAEIRTSFLHPLLEKYKSYVVVAKSIGTIAIEQAKENIGVDGKVDKYLWLTPFENSNDLEKMDLGKDIFYVGDQDHYYNEEVYNNIGTSVEVNLFSGLDHALIKKESVLESVSAMQAVIKRLKKQFSG